MKFHIVLFSLVLGMWWFSSVRAETIVLAVPGPGTLSYLPIYLAKAIAADQAEGLELRFRHFPGGPLAIRDLNSYNSDFAAVALPVIASARADGMPVVAIGQLSQDEYAADINGSRDAAGQSLCQADAYP